MKKFLGTILGLSFILPFAAANAPQRIPDGEICGVFSETAVAETVSSEKEIDLGLNAKAAYLMDWASGTEIYAKNADERLPIASMCKIMTMILCFDEIEKGNLSLDEEVRVSENAASMGGSQVFLEANASYPVRELIKSIAVCSANDSCVAMAERIAGSESLFTDRMNARAKELGAENTLFANCTGLPREPQYSCSRDVAKMLSELVSHPAYFGFSTVWTDKFSHPEGRYTEISNTNRLVRFYEGCDGGKTGYTSQAGFCLAATAKRGEMRLISVVIGEDSSEHRFKDVRTMLDYAFANYSLRTVVDENVPLNERAAVSGGKERSVAVRPERSAHIFCARGSDADVRLDVKLKGSIKAPVKEGDRVGEIIVYRDHVETERVALIADGAVGEAGLADYFRRVAQGWML